MKLPARLDGPERRAHRRHELAASAVAVHRPGVDGKPGDFVGVILDLSAGGVRIRTGVGSDIKPGETIAVELNLPEHAGIRPFIRLAGSAEPACEWDGQLEVLRRIENADGSFDLGGRLLGMSDNDRGMLGLYLSIQPLAA